LGSFIADIHETALAFTDEYDDGGKLRLLPFTWLSVPIHTFRSWPDSFPLPRLSYFIFNGDGNAFAIEPSPGYDCFMAFLLVFIVCQLIFYRLPSEPDYFRALCVVFLFVLAGYLRDCHRPVDGILKAQVITQALRFCHPNFPNSYLAISLPLRITALSIIESEWLNVQIICTFRKSAIRPSEIFSRLDTDESLLSFRSMMMLSASSITSTLPDYQSADP